MKLRGYLLGGVLGGLLALGPAALAQDTTTPGNTSGPAAGTNVAPQTGTGAGGAVGVPGPRDSENGPAPHVRRHHRSRHRSHMSGNMRNGNMHNGNMGNSSGPAAGTDIAPQTGTGAGGAAGMAGPRGSENGPAPQGGSSNTQ